MSEQISRDRLITDLKLLGVKLGDHIGLGMSFKSLGGVIGGPEAFVDALLDVVGPEGTIMVNTFTANLRLSELGISKLDKIFDFRTSPANTGIIPETIRKRPDAIRSKHPVTSISAIGKLAFYLTNDHDQYSPAYMPYSMLSKSNGKILSIGINDRLVGFRHQAQYQAGLLTIIPFKRGIRYKDTEGSVKLFRWKDPGGCVETLPELVQTLRKNGIVKDGNVGRAQALLVQAKEALNIMTALLKEQPTLNLCGKVSCLWCREIERRLNLYSKIKNPRFFQRYRSIIELIGWINKARLNNYRMVARSKKLIKMVLNKT